jgi:hypothetical protein
MVWICRKRLDQLGETGTLFDRFGDLLVKGRLRPRAGLIVDATNARVAVQCNLREENANIRPCDVPTYWSTARCQEKNVHARGTYPGV